MNLKPICPVLAAAFIQLPLTTPAAGLGSANNPLVLLGHKGGTFARYSPDGRTIVSTSDDRTVRLWDAATGRMIRVLETNEWAVSAAFSPDGDLLALRTTKGVRLVETGSGRLIRFLESSTEGLPKVAFSPDGRLVAAGDSKRTVRVWNAATGALLHTLLGTTNHLAFSVGFLPDSQRLVTGAGNGVGSAGDISLWDLRTGKRQWTDTDEQVWSLAVVPDGSAVAYQTTQQKVALVDAQTGKFLRQFHTGDDCRAVAISPDGKLLAATSRNQIKLWELTTGQQVKTLAGHANWVGSLAFSPDGKHLVSGSSDHTIRIWDLQP